MKGLFGIFLLDHTEIILRIYQIDEKEWRLLHALSKNLPTKTDETPLAPLAITEVILDFLGKRATQHITDWQLCSRGIPEETIHAVSEATGLAIECLLPSREQELICKGLFTELW